MNRPLLGFLLAASLSSACSGTKTTPTYYTDIQPILQTKCAGCHTAGGIAPFALETPDDAVAHKSLIKSAVASGTMPPWPPASTCTDYKNDRSLSDAEKKAITSWVDAGAPLGDASRQVKGPAAPGMSRVDLTLQMPVPFTPVLSPDDYRCFLVDWTPTTTKFVTGLGVKPGDPRIVHHVIAYIAPPAQVAAYQAMDDQEDGPGWTCFGGPGNGTKAQWLGAWAPGALGSDFPAGTGVRIEPGSKIVIQVHYNTAAVAPVPDQSSVNVEIADSVTKEAYVTPFTDPGWVLGGMQIAAGNPDANYSVSMDLSSNLSRISKGLFKDNAPVTVHSSALHMHTRGTQIRSKILKADNSEDCLLDIPRWNFAWQGSYGFAQAKVMNPGDQLYLECHWNNTAANQPYVNGSQVPAKDVYWGESTEDEMCLEILYLTQ
jgi:hypothetical protein